MTRLKCFSFTCLCILHTLLSVFYLFFLVSGLAVACDCGTHWTFRLTFFLWFNELSCLKEIINIIMTSLYTDFRNSRSGYSEQNFFFLSSKYIPIRMQYWTAFLPSATKEHCFYLPFLHKERRYFYVKISQSNRKKLYRHSPRSYTFSNISPV